MKHVRDSLIQIPKKCIKIFILKEFSWKPARMRPNVSIEIVKKNIRWLWNKNLTMDLFPTSQIFAFRIFRWSTTIRKIVHAVQLRVWFLSIWNCIGWNIFSSISSNVRKADENQLAPPSGQDCRNLLTKLDYALNVMK